MGCGEREEFKKAGANCVARVIREIVKAQNDVVNDVCCDVSCEQSISDLLGETENGNNLDTVPVILYCKGTCKPFKAYAVNEARYGGERVNDRPTLGDVESSFFFRPKSVTNDNCAVLELLIDDACDDNDEESGGHGKHKKKHDPKTPADQKVRNLEATGLCITVDLNCFCHVTCLPAIEALC